MGKEHDRLMLKVCDEKTLCKIFGDNLTKFELEHQLPNGTFIDLLLTFESKNYNFKRICEIKTEKDLDDVGEIIRQIKNYKRCLEYKEKKNTKILCCLIIPSIDERLKNLFYHEFIEIVELNKIFGQKELQK